MVQVKVDGIPFPSLYSLKFLVSCTGFQLKVV